jgi:hypothetical protein
MNDYLLLMRSDMVDERAASDEVRWTAYFKALRNSGQFAAAVRSEQASVFARLALQLR